jgi:hypothetical protein
MRGTVMYADSRQTAKLAASLGPITTVTCKHENNFASVLYTFCHIQGRKNTEPNGMEVTLWICIQYVLGSNLDRDTGYADWEF